MPRDRDEGRGPDEAASREHTSSGDERRSTNEAAFRERASSDDERQHLIVRPKRTLWRLIVRSAGPLLLVGGALVMGGLVDLRVASELEPVRGERVRIEARAAALAGRHPTGRLTLVTEEPSERYFFLKRRRYLENTRDLERRGALLIPAVPFDLGRAERHAEARRKNVALLARLEDGSWRATVPGKDASGGQASVELEASPPSIPVTSSLRFALGGAALGLFAFLALARRSRALAIGSGVLIVLAVLWRGADVALADAATSAGSYLAQPFAFDGLSDSVRATVRDSVQDSMRASVHDSVRVIVHDSVRASVRESYQWIGGEAATFELWTPSALGVRLTLLGAASVLTLLLVLLSSEAGARFGRALYRDRLPWLAAGPAVFAMAVLIGIPFIVGIALSLFRHKHGTYTFVGLENFAEILFSPNRGYFEPQSLTYALAMTVGWTVINVSLHLGIGLVLALLLQNRAPRAAKIYRVLLILPWAVPAYLTALIWKSMFDPDIGVVNRALGLEGMSWMHETATAFLANLVTNVWLGFSFMMVVSLGALASIPKDLYEAAEVDGASWFQQFLRITLPLLRPALLPAVILGSIWTFNKFDVIYLVSEGGPDGATEILVTEAYKWAFERGLAEGGAYGYAAAYSVVIFLVLLVYGWMTQRVSRAAEEALR